MTADPLSGYPPRIFRESELPSKDRGSGAMTTPMVTSARGATSSLNRVTEVGVVPRSQQSHGARTFALERSEESSAGRRPAVA